MLENFHLVAILQNNNAFNLFRIPLHRDLQQILSVEWQSQYEVFLKEKDEIPFNAGYKPEEHELFAINDFALPDCLAQESSETVQNLESIENNAETLESIRGVTAFARNNGEEIILFQNFTRSHIIQPGKFIFLTNDVYETLQNPVLTLDKKLSAVYFPGSRKLLFQSFRVVNTFLPLADFYKEATEQEIRSILSHDKLAPENIDRMATEANQWFRKRFALLRDSGLLDEYSVNQIRNRSNGYNVNVIINDGKIVFPEDKKQAKRLLQFLCEEIYRGPITEKVYETNSKREID